MDKELNEEPLDDIKELDEYDLSFLKYLKDYGYITRKGLNKEVDITKVMFFTVPKLERLGLISITDEKYLNGKIKNSIYELTEEGEKYLKEHETSKA